MPTPAHILLARGESIVFQVSVCISIQEPGFDHHLHLECLLHIGVELFPSVNRADCSPSLLVLQAVACPDD